MSLSPKQLAFLDYMKAEGPHVDVWASFCAGWDAGVIAARSVSYLRATYDAWERGVLEGRELEREVAG